MTVCWPNLVFEVELLCNVVYSSVSAQKPSNQSGYVVSGELCSCLLGSVYTLVGIGPFEVYTVGLQVISYC